MSIRDPATPPRWSGEVRSWVSLLLFVHLFALFVAVTAYTRPSSMQQRLHELFEPYLRNLHLTPTPSSYPFARFYLTLALPGDVDFSCEVETKSKNGNVETTSIPQQGLQPLVRYRRYQALANSAGALAADEGSENSSGILPRAIAGSILGQRQATQGIVKLRAHYLPELETMGNVEAGRMAVLENYRTMYEAQVFLSGGGVELLKKSTTLETAPVEKLQGAGRSQP
jgi:hypothetical protein